MLFRLFKSCNIAVGRAEHLISQEALHCFWECPEHRNRSSGQQGGTCATLQVRMAE